MNIHELDNFYINFCKDLQCDNCKQSLKVHGNFDYVCCNQNCKIGNKSQFYIFKKNTCCNIIKLYRPNYNNDKLYISFSLDCVFPTSNSFKVSSKDNYMSGDIIPDTKLPPNELMDLINNISLLERRVKKILILK